MPRALTLLAAFLAAVAVGAGAGIAVYAGVGTPHSKTVVHEVTVASAQPASRAPVDAAEIYQTTHKGVVEITVSVPEGQAQGSGWVYDSKGDIVTNDHVVDGASSIKVQF